MTVFLKSSLTIILMVLKLNTCISDGSIDCDTTEDVVNTEELDLNFFGVIKTFFDVKIRSVISTTNNNFDELYIDAIIEEEDGHTNLVIFTTENFQNYGREQTSPKIFLNIKFECPGGERRTQLFYQPLREGNYFQPEFSQEAYEVTIPTPLYKGFELTVFQEIYATDFDLTGSDITFSSNDSKDSNIVISTLKNLGKRSIASLKLMTILLSINEQMEFSIVATDSGNPPQQSKPAKVIITPDSSNSLPPIPRFDKTVYFESLTEEFILPELQITLDATTYSSDVSFEKLSDVENIFKIDNINNVVFVTLQSNDREYLKRNERLTFEIEASNKKLKETARTAVSIFIPKAKEMQFTKTLYKGKLFTISSTFDIENIEILGNAKEFNEVQLELQNLHHDLFDVSRDHSTVELFLKPDPNVNKLNGLNYISLTLTAKTNSGKVFLTHIHIDIVHLIIRFSQSAFFGNLTSRGYLTMDPIQLVADSNLIEGQSEWKDIEFLLTGRDARYFSYQQHKSFVNVFLKEELDFKGISYLCTELKMISLKENLTDSALIVIQIDHEPIPEFEKPTYIGELIEENFLNISHVDIKTSTWRNYTSVVLAGDYSMYFEHIVVNDEIIISLKSELPDEVGAQNFLVLMVIASNYDVKGYATVVIRLGLGQNLGNIFKNSIQSGKMFEDENLHQTLEVDEIELISELDVVNYTCELSGDESKYFDYTVIAPKNVIKLNLAEDLPFETLQKLFYTTILLHCKNKENVAVTGSTLIFIALPGNNVETTCPTPEPPSFVPKFEKEFYNLYAKPNFVGLLKKIQATVMDSNTDVRYMLAVPNDHLRSRMDIDSISGEIFLSALTSPGTYNFDIIAENMETHAKGIAKAQLDIKALIQCEDHVTVSNFLLIKHLAEETEHQSILEGAFGNCELDIYSIEPDDRGRYPFAKQLIDGSSLIIFFPEYVKIDPITKKYTMIPTDREDAAFANMIVPQISVKFKLYCSDGRSERNDISSRLKRNVEPKSTLGVNKSLVLTDDIVFAKDFTMLTVIILDINDNRPKFIYPNSERFFIGFPGNEAPLQLFGENIIQVVATDNDQGLNAKIRYSIQPNEHFEMDPVSGKLYPFANAMRKVDELSLIVYATDKDGANDGLTTRFTLFIKVLSARHFTLLTSVNEKIKTVEALIDDAKNKTNINFIALKHLVTSMGTTATGSVPRFKNASVKFVQKVWVYAFDGEIPILSTDIKRKISESTNDVHISAQTVEEVIGVIDSALPSCIQNVTGYIAGLSVLAFIICVCIGIIAWRWKIIGQRQVHREAANDLSSRSNSNQNFNLKQGAEIDIQKHADILNPVPFESSFYSRRESVNIIGTTTHESTDFGRQMQIPKIKSTLGKSIEETNDGSESDASNESVRPRATVTFNELVERIHIDSDDDDKKKL